MILSNHFRSTQIFIFLVLVALLPLHDVDGVVNVSMALSLIALIPDYRNLYTIRYILGAWALFAIWYLASSLWSLYPEHAYSGLRKEVLYSVVCFILGFSVALHLKSLKPALYASVISLTLLFLSSMARGGADYIGFMEKYYPSVGDGSTSLVFFVSLAITLLFVKKQYSIFTAVFIAVVSLWLAVFYENRMVFVSFASIIAACFLYKSRLLSAKAKTISLIAVIATSFFIIVLSLSIKSERNQGYLENAITVAKEDPRIYMWDFYIDKGLEKPTFGYGAGYHTIKDSLRSQFPESFNKFMKDHAHNVLLNKWLQMGGIGLLLFFTLYSVAFYKGITGNYSDNEKALKLLLLLIFVGFFSKSMTDDFFIRNNLLLFWLVTGFILGRTNKLKAEPVNHSTPG